MNIKAEKFKMMLDQLQNTSFEMREVEGPLHPAVFATNLKVKDKLLPTKLLLDDSLYAVFRVYLAANVVKANKRYKMLKHLNELNKKYRIFKFCIFNNTDIVMDCCIGSSDERFDPALFWELIKFIPQPLETEYPAIMDICKS